LSLQGYWHKNLSKLSNKRLIPGISEG
jgi:hypothetical protein